MNGLHPTRWIPAMAALAASLVACPSSTFAADFGPGNAACPGYTVAATQPGSDHPPGSQGIRPWLPLGQAMAGPGGSTCVVRATDHRAQPMDGFARVSYSRIQAFNADDTLMVVLAGDEMIHLHSVRDLAHVRALPDIGGIDGEPQWHASDPRLIRFFPRANRAAIAEMDVESGQTRVLVDFTTTALPWEDVARVATRWEGSPSADGRYWCLMAYGPEEHFRGVFTYDLQEGDVLAHRSMARAPDHVSMSASGRHCVVSHEREHGGTRAWDRSLGHSKALHAASEHSDLALSPDGEDLYVFVDYDTDGYLVAIDLDTLVRTRLVPTYIEGSTTAYHVSARNIDRPGWVVVSTYAHEGPEQPIHGRVLAVQLTAAPRVVELAEHRSRFTSYWTAPVATVNRDFTRVLFNSNWGSGRERDMDVYMILVPPGLLEPAPQ